LVFQYGPLGGLAVVGDWQGTGQTGIGVFDPSTATWFLRNEASAGLADAGVFAFGPAGGQPLAGDWTGTGHSGSGAPGPPRAPFFLGGRPAAGPPDAGQFAFGPTGALPVAGTFSLPAQAQPADAHGLLDQLFAGV